MGSDGLTEHVKKTLGIDFHETTADGKFTPRAGLLPRQLRLLARGACGTTTCSGASHNERFDELLAQWKRGE